MNNKKKNQTGNKYTEMAQMNWLWQISYWFVITKFYT
jgi:hypothetical protein